MKLGDQVIYNGRLGDSALDGGPGVVSRPITSEDENGVIWVKVIYPTKWHRNIRTGEEFIFTRKSLKVVYSKFKVGDMVETTKGDAAKYNGTPGPHEVVEVDRRWRFYPAIVCKKPNGDNRMFLEKNLVKVK